MEDTIIQIMPLIGRAYLGLSGRGNIYLKKGIGVNEEWEKISESPQLTVKD